MGRLIDAEPYAGCRIVANREDSGVSIDEIKTVDAVPVVHGRWHFDDFDGDGKDYTCSVCGWVCDSDYDYCPNCGAKMTEKGEANDRGEEKSQ